MANSIQINTVYTYDLDGVTTQFNVPFEYLSRNFVVVTLVGQDRKVLVNNTDFIFTTASTIRTLKVWGSADGYQYIEVRRETSATDRLVDFQNGSVLRATDLNVSSIQSMHIAEEARDLVGTTMGVDLDGNLDARGKRITNVVDGVNAQDVVTIHQMDTWNNTAKQSADRSEAKANEAKASATAAANSLNDVKQQVELAKTQVSLATEQVSLATEQVTKATEQATIAISNAETAHIDAATATEQATIAKENADKLVQFNDLTDRINSVAVSEVGEVLWHHSRTNMKIGCAAGDGQLLLRASYPDLWSMVEQNLVPVVTEAVWQSDVSRRGSYTTGTDETNFRIPDYNGVTSDSIKAPVMRGDGGLADGTVQKSGVPNVVGEVTATASYGFTEVGSKVTPPFKLGTTNMNGFNGNGGSTTARSLIIDLSTASNVYTTGLTEARMNSVVGCYVIRVFGVLYNPGNIDIGAIATQVEVISNEVKNNSSSIDLLNSQVNSHNSRIIRLEQNSGYALIQTTSG